VRGKIFILIGVIVCLNLLIVGYFLTDKNNVLGDFEENSNKRIEIDLSRQRLYAIEDGKILHNFRISSGTWDRTPNGVFKIWARARLAKMSGGLEENGTYYYLPNVPYILYFYNEVTPKMRGFAIHGAYWHNNFGMPKSHGCINMKPLEAGEIYSWADKNTFIKIYGKYQYHQTLPDAGI